MVEVGRRIHDHFQSARGHTCKTGGVLWTASVCQMISRSVVSVTVLREGEDMKWFEVSLLGMARLLQSLTCFTGVEN